MRCKIPYLIQDPFLIQRKEITDAIEYVKLEERFFLSGPICSRVAILDFDDSTGDLRAGLQIEPRGGDECSYRVTNPSDIESDEFIQINTFSTVMATLKMFEEKDVLGREVKWAFDAPQLLVIPRAGDWANAFYERESHSLQLFYFESANEHRGTVYTALSQDIIAHETTHAILDGIAPDLYHALSPQSLAMHEAVADLGALMLALCSDRLRTTLLEQTDGTIAGQNAYSKLAEQFGYARDRTGRANHLRTLWNERTLDPEDPENGVDRTEPHDLSEVLSGALYRVFADIHEQQVQRIVHEEGKTRYSASGKALFIAHQHFKRLVLRSLDYLPPGEVSFADYGRAILASDTASYGPRSAARERLKKELVHRHIVASESELEVETNFRDDDVSELDLEVLVSSDWAAYEFANRKRALFGIPNDVPIWVRKRLRATKTYWTPDGPGEVTECIFKVSWDLLEENPHLPSLPSRRQITVGTTLVIDWESKEIRVLLTSQAAQLDLLRPTSKAPPEELQRDLAAARQLKKDRDDMLLRLVRGRRLAVGPEPDHIDEAHFATAARAEVSDDVMRIRASGKMLHVASADEEG